MKIIHILHPRYHPKIIRHHSVQHPHFLQGGGEVEPPTKFSKRGWGLTGPQLLEGVCWERGGDFFQGGLQFSHKR